MANSKSPLTIQQGFPGQMGLLAQQMNQGFGGGLLAQKNYLNDVYSPYKMPTTTVSTPNTPKKPSALTAWEEFLARTRAAPTNQQPDRQMNVDLLMQMLGRGA